MNNNEDDDNDFASVIIRQIYFFPQMTTSNQISRIINRFLYACMHI